MLCCKEVVPFHKRSRAMWENVARSRMKSRDSGKSWAFPDESSLVCAKSFRFFCYPWEGTRAGRDFKEAGCGDRAEGWRACEEDRLPRMKKWDDEERHVSSLWKKGRVRDCLRGGLLCLLRRRGERSALWAVPAGEGVRPQRTRTNEKRRLHE